MEPLSSRKTKLLISAPGPKAEKHCLCWSETLQTPTPTPSVEETALFSPAMPVAVDVASLTQMVHQRLRAGWPMCQESNPLPLPVGSPDPSSLVAVCNKHRLRHRKKKKKKNKHMYTHTVLEILRHRHDCCPFQNVSSFGSRQPIPHNMTRSFIMKVIT